MRPNFLIIGAPRAGTTSLYKFLDSFDDVCFPSKKELWFFYPPCNINLEKKNYEEQFHQCRGFRMVGEATPLYFCNEFSMRDIKKLYPDIKLIIMLRDPVTRFLSHYKHNVLKGREYRPIRLVIADEKGREKKVLASRDDIKGSFDYLGIGCYAEHIERIYTLFEKDAICVLILEEVIEDKKNLVPLLSFLKINARKDVKFPTENSHRISFTDHIIDNCLRIVRYLSLGKLHMESNRMRSLFHATTIGRKILRRQLFNSDASCSDVAQLTSFYSDHNKKLEALLARKIGCWSKPD